ncbi:MAG TPA: terminase family protein [Kiloniellaceae bacterium]|nr:terminase family protein [Kiloniellaceae bacterium]
MTRKLPKTPPVPLVVRGASPRRIDSFYPDDGPLRRELYIPHTAYFRGGAKHRERLFMAGNRVGKTEGVGGYEVTLHLTGQYPHWWEGRRFDRPVRAVAAGETAKTTRDIIQRKLLGPAGAFGTGMIPRDALSRTTRKSGTSEAVDSIYVRHASGGESVLLLRSFDQGARAFQGDEQDVVWMDEEPPMAVYTEALMRTMTTNGLVMLTFTPLKGYTELVRHFTDNPETERI